MTSKHMQHYRVRKLMLACPYCFKYTCYEWLEYSRKHVCTGYRQFLEHENHFQRDKILSDVAIEMRDAPKIAYRSRNLRAST